MSAFLVSRNHIQYMVEASMRYANPTFTWFWNNERHDLGCGDYERAAWVGQMLWEENNRSVNARYNEQEEAPEYSKHRIRACEYPNAVQVLKACDCYEYQACETKDWEESQAFAFVRSLRKAAIRHLEGYEDAAWDIE